MISFEVAGSAEDAEAVCAARPADHQRDQPGRGRVGDRAARPARRATPRSARPPTLLRFSVGIEHVEDLWADLAQALG